MIRDNRSSSQRRKVGGGYYGASNDPGNPSAREAAQFYNKATRDFDAWFSTLTKQEQARLRLKGVLPYSEMKADEYVFPVNTESESTPITSLYDQTDKVLDETFYSRERVEEFTRRLLDTLEYSHSQDVRLHFELVRLVLKDARAMTNEALAKRFGMTRAGINFRVQHIRALLSGKKPKNTANAFFDASNVKNNVKTGVKRPLRVVKESPKGGRRHRVARAPR